MDFSTFQSVATQMMSADSVELDGHQIPVRRTTSQRLRTVAFTVDGHAYTAIEQNPDKPSRWGQLARASARKALELLPSDAALDANRRQVIKASAEKKLQ